MSHCLILQRYHDFYIGADTAGSVKIKDNFYRVSNDMKKIFTFGTDTYFCSGSNYYVAVCNTWIQENCSHQIDITSLQSFLKHTCLQNIDDNCFDIELLICRICDGVSYIYHLAQYNDFDIITYQGKPGGINILCGGCKTNLGFNLAKDIISCGSVKDIYQYVFSQIQDERIGGSLIVYHNQNCFYETLIDNICLDIHLMLADCMVGGYIEGATLKGGQLEIGGEGGTFKVNPDGSVEILGADGSSTYATKSDFQQAVGWTIEITSDGPTIFTDKNQTTTLSCKVYNQGEDKTNTISSSKFKWIRTSSDTSSDNAWNSKHVGTKTIAITHSDIENNATICCKVDIETT